MSLGILNSKEIKAFEEIHDIEHMESELTNIYTLLEPELNSIKKSYRSFLADMIKKKNKKRVKIIVGVKPLNSLKS